MGLIFNFLQSFSTSYVIMSLQGNPSLGLLLPSESLQIILQLSKLSLLVLGFLLFFQGLVKVKETIYMHIDRGNCVYS